METALKRHDEILNKTVHLNNRDSPCAFVYVLTKYQAKGETLMEAQCNFLHEIFRGDCIIEK
jgi:hypothetical protein